MPPDFCHMPPGIRASHFRISGPKMRKSGPRALRLTAIEIPLWPCRDYTCSCYKDGRPALQVRWLLGKPKPVRK
jgi:hypothetical protein